MTELPIDKVFDIIRAHSKYCSVCGAKLDLGDREWHLPFCTRCRMLIIDKAVEQKASEIKNQKKLDDGW